MTPDAKEQLLDGLRKAMAAESEGHHFYRMAVLTTEDPKGKEVFAQLAEEEMDHFRFLQRQLESVESTGKLDESLQLQRIADLRGASPIFSEGLKARVKDAHFEMTALSMGIQLELNAINHYQAQADLATDKTVKQFFLGLVAWEQGHYRGLLNQQNELKGDYWAGSGFTPY